MMFYATRQRRLPLKSPISIAAALAILWMGQGCAFNFEITSQRTALENQVIGSYQEIQDDVVTSSSVRSLDESGGKKRISMSQMQEEAVKARQNQQFNLDDLDELKEAEVIGEQSDGLIALLPAGIGKAESSTSEQKKLASQILKEENRDRQSIWKRIVMSNESLAEKDLPEVRKTFAKLQRDNAVKGNWLQDEAGKWFRKL